MKHSALCVCSYHGEAHEYQPGHGSRRRSGERARHPADDRHRPPGAARGGRSRTSCTARRARLRGPLARVPRCDAAACRPHGVTELADTSAWSWSRRRAYPDLRRAFDGALIDGELATCDMVRLELLHSARSASEFAEIREELTALPDCPIDKTQWDRALCVYEQLSAQGGTFQRSVKHPDLLIAAAAEAAGVAVLHYDEEYDRIASITGQPTRWLAPAGSLR